MKIRFLRNHGIYRTGQEVTSEQDYRLTDGTIAYLIKVGAAEEVGIEVAEKREVKKVRTKEKAENKTGNVPGAVTVKSIKKK